MASTYLTRTPGSAGNRKTWTQSFWCKRGNLGTSQHIGGTGGGSNTTWFQLKFNTDDTFLTQIYDGTLASITSRVFRDPSAWYHFVVTVDTTEATASDRVKIWVNGEQQSLTHTRSLTLNQDTGINSTEAYFIGRTSAAYTDYFDGSLAHFHNIDGLAYDASTFGETNAASGIWTPIAFPSVTYGTNGFFLKFGSSGALGTDSSGEGNDFTVNGSGTQTQDAPSNVFATMNPLVYNPNQANYNPLFSNGNTTTSSNTSVNAFSNARATFAVTQGKWYAEFKITSSDANMAIGLINYTSGVRSANNWGLTYQNDGAVSFNPNGSIDINNVTSGTSFSGYASGDILQLAFDRTSEKIWLGKNGTWFNSGVPSTGTNELLDLSSTIGNDEFWTFAVGFYHSVSEVWDANYGNGYFGTTAVASGNADGAGYGIFEYAPPTGYYSLCTKNINTYG